METIEEFPARGGQIERIEAHPDLRAVLCGAVRAIPACSPRSRALSSGRQVDV
jgi:hypothetical protein